MHPKAPKTSWQNSSEWYNDTVGEQGHYYHQHIILPQLKKILTPETLKDGSMLDLACGQGVLARALPKRMTYFGIDASKDLIASAKQLNHSPAHTFLVGDITKKLPIEQKNFTHAAVILALQNIEQPEKVIENAASHLCENGQLVLVLNHPCFRIPRQSSWKIDEQNKIQFRRIDRYMSAMEIPIQTNPGKGKVSSTTFSYHHPLSSICRWLKQEGFMIEMLEEWCSNKVSQGAAAKMENRSREEFPLFMAIVARKIKTQSHRDHREGFENV